MIPGTLTSPTYSFGFPCPTTSNGNAKLHVPCAVLIVSPHTVSGTWWAFKSTQIYSGKPSNGWGSREWQINLTFVISETTLTCIFLETISLMGFFLPLILKKRKILFFFVQILSGCLHLSRPGDESCNKCLTRSSGRRENMHQGIKFLGWKQNGDLNYPSAHFDPFLLKLWGHLIKRLVSTIH